MCALIRRLFEKYKFFVNLSEKYVLLSSKQRRWSIEKPARQCQREKKVRIEFGAR